MKDIHQDPDHENQNTPITPKDHDPHVIQINQNIPNIPINPEIIPSTPYHHPKNPKININTVLKPILHQNHLTNQTNLK